MNHAERYVDFVTAMDNIQESWDSSTVLTIGK